LGGQGKLNTRRKKEKGGYSKGRSAGCIKLNLLHDQRRNERTGPFEKRKVQGLGKRCFGKKKKEYLSVKSAGKTGQVQDRSAQKKGNPTGEGKRTSTVGVFLGPSMKGWKGGNVCSTTGLG